MRVLRITFCDKVLPPCSIPFRKLRPCRWRSERRLSFQPWWKTNFIYLHTLSKLWLGSSCHCSILHHLLRFNSSSSAQLRLLYFRNCFIYLFILVWSAFAGSTFDFWLGSSCCYSILHHLLKYSVSERTFTYHSWSVLSFFRIIHFGFLLKVKEF